MCLPPELLEEIIEYLRDSRETLKSCALSCRPLLLPSQKRLFSSVTIRGPRKLDMKWLGGPPDEGCSSKQLGDLLESSPHLAIFVRNLKIQDRRKYRARADRYHQVPNATKRWLREDTNLSRALSYLKNLHSFFLELSAFPYFDALPTATRLSIIGLIQSPSLKRLTLRGVPPLLFKCNSNLRDVSIDCLLSENPEPLSDIPQHDIPLSFCFDSLSLQGSIHRPVYELLSDRPLYHLPILKKLRLEPTFTDVSSFLVTFPILLRRWSSTLEEVSIVIPSTFVCASPLYSLCIYLIFWQSTPLFRPWAASSILKSSACSSSMAAICQWTTKYNGLGRSSKPHWKHQVLSEQLRSWCPTLL